MNTLYAGMTDEEIIAFCRDRMAGCKTAEQGAVPLLVFNGIRGNTKMATSRRYMSSDYARAVASQIRGGDFRSDPEHSARLFNHCAGSRLRASVPCDTQRALGLRNQRVLDRPGP